MSHLYTQGQYSLRPWILLSKMRVTLKQTQLH